MYAKLIALLVTFYCPLHSMGWADITAMGITDSSNSARVSYPNEWIRIHPSLYKIAATCRPAIPVKCFEVKALLSNLDEHESLFWGFITWFIPSLHTTYSLEKLLETYEQIRGDGFTLKKDVGQVVDNFKRKTYLHRLPPELLDRINNILGAKQNVLQDVCKISPAQAAQTVREFEDGNYTLWLSPVHICGIAPRLSGTWQHSDQLIRKYGVEPEKRIRSPIFAYVRALEHVNTLYRKGVLANAKDTLEKLSYIQTNKEPELRANAFGINT